MAEAAAGAGDGIAVSGYKYPMQHLGLPSAAEVKMVRDVLTVDLDWDTMPLSYSASRDRRFEFGAGEETRRFCIDFASGPAKFGVRLKVHESLITHCLGLAWALPDFTKPGQIMSFARNDMRQHADSEWYYELWEHIEPKRSVRKMRVVVTTFLPLSSECRGAVDIAYLKQVTQGMFDTRRCCGSAIILTSDEKKIEVDKGLMKASGYVPLAAPFCDLAFHTARMPCPEVTWDLNYDAALLVVKAICLGPNRAWSDVVTSDDVVDTWMSILAFVQSMLMTAFVQPATQLVRRCVSTRVYAKVLAVAMRHGWSDILAELEARAKRDTGAVLASFDTRHSRTPMATASVAAQSPAANAMARATTTARDLNTVSSVMSGIRVELGVDKLRYDRWEMSPVYDMPGSPGVKIRLMFQKWSPGDSDVRYVLAINTVHGTAPRTVTYWIPELKTGPIIQTLSDASSYPFDMAKESQDKTLGEKWRCFRHCYSDLIRPSEVSLRVTAYYEANAAPSPTDDAELRRAERMLAMAKEAEHVDIALLSSKTETKDDDRVAAFAHTVVLAASSKELEQLVREAPRPVAVAAASTRSPEAAAVLDHCREIRLDATTNAIILMRNALYHGGALSPLLFASGHVALDDLADLVALCRQLNASGLSVAFCNLEALARDAFARRITGHNFAKVLEMTKLPKYTTLRQGVEDFVQANPEVLSALVFLGSEPKSRPPQRAAAAAAAAAIASGGGSDAVGSKRVNDTATATDPEGPPAKRPRVSPAYDPAPAAASAAPAVVCPSQFSRPAAAAASAARSLDDDDGDA